VTTGKNSEGIEVWRYRDIEAFGISAL